jgi:hypothetical protein
MVGIRELGLSGSGQGPVACCYEASDSINGGEFIDQLRSYKYLKLLHGVAKYVHSVRMIDNYSRTDFFSLFPMWP